MKSTGYRDVLLAAILFAVGWSPSQGQTVDPYEPNNSNSLATMLAVPAAITASISPELDADWYRWNVLEGSIVEVSLQNTEASLLDAALWLYDSGGELLAYNDDWGSTQAARVRYTSETARSYHLRVAYYGNAPGAGDSTGSARVVAPTGGYHLAITVYRWPSNHFTARSRTGSNAVIGISEWVGPTLNGLPLEDGDEIAVFADGASQAESLCVGATTWWENSGAAITVWGDDPMTPELDGATPGGRLTFRVWKLRWDREYPTVDVRFSEGPTTNESNGISTLSWLEARPVFDHRTRTGGNATIGIPAEITPSVYDLPLEPGDEVGVFVEAAGVSGGLCVGSITWIGMSTAISVWGDDPLTSAQDGALPGDALELRVWKNRWNRVVFPVAAEFDGPSMYVENGISVLTSLKTASHYVVRSNTGSNATIGIPSTAVLRLGTSPLPPGFIIGVFSAQAVPNPLCVGVGTWTGPSMAITIWGDDVMTPEIDGLQAGEWFRFKVYDIVNQVEYHLARPVFRAGNPVYVQNGLWQLDSLIVSTSTSVADEYTPADFTLEQNYPNPFNSSTKVEFRNPKAQHLRLSIVDLLGREVASLIDDERPPGIYSIVWDAAGLSSGIYLCQLWGEGKTMTRRMVLMK